MFENIYGFFRDLDKSSDPRVNDLFLMGSSWSVTIVVVAYLYFVLKAAPKWMEHQKPFDLTKIINAYNILQMAANLYAFVFTIYYLPQHEDFRFFCPPEARRGTSPISVKLLYSSYGYFLLKVLDLCDTIFFVLRKKKNQISFLHLYHHTSMVLTVFLYIKLHNGGGYLAITTILNCPVHVVMFGYYFITSYKPELKNLLWWKKYITQLQLLQFLAKLVYLSYILLFGDCNNSFPYLCFGVFQALWLTALFTDFYYKSYIKKKL